MRSTTPPSWRACAARVSVHVELIGGTVVGRLDQYCARQPGCVVVTVHSPANGKITCSYFIPNRSSLCCLHTGAKVRVFDLIDSAFDSSCSCVSKCPIKAGAKVKVFDHNDPAHLEAVLRSAIAEGQPRTGRPWKKIVSWLGHLHVCLWPGL